VIHTNKLLTSAAALVLTLAIQSTSSVAVSAEISWQSDPGVVLQSAQQTGKPIVVFVSTKWCHYCTQMKHQTWANDSVSQSVPQAFHTLQLDGERDQAVVAPFQLRSYPATLVFSPDGRLIDQRQGYMAPHELLTWLHKNSQF